MEIAYKNVTFDEIKTELFTQKGVQVFVLRLDKIHNTISGNKFFKLYYYQQECLQTEHKTLLTFGGAFSNHLAATAYSCKINGLKSIGIIRGEAPKILSHTLQACEADGMRFHFMSRNDYKNKLQIEAIKLKFGDCTIVPEGGFGKLGANGASLIFDYLKDKNVSHICTAVGTATTLSGLLQTSSHLQKIIAVPVLKNMIDIEERILELTGKSFPKKLDIFFDFHFGGYAKHNNELTNFMNKLYLQFLLPTDFVYTAKMMYAVFNKIENNYFVKGSKIVCIHTGGLQGNLSLPTGTLIF
ncbi:MAG: 1-aminocyclopropane-1-carboxylate deaminase [Ferruginibacter sp.]|nr:1-aminocyclopropane-1-carboxylate deaminase [Ferruginibacter sp.]